MSDFEKQLKQVMDAKKAQKDAEAAKVAQEEANRLAGIESAKSIINKTVTFALSDVVQKLIAAGVHGVRVEPVKQGNIHWKNAIEPRWVSVLHIARNQLQFHISQQPGAGYVEVTTIPHLEETPVSFGHWQSVELREYAERWALMVVRSLP